MSLSPLRRALALLVVLAPAAAFAANPFGLATIVDGEAVLVRGVVRLALGEGVPVEGGDIVETAAKASIVRLELADGTVLDLGPDTRVLLAPRWRDARRARPADVYLLHGWTKLASAATSTAPAKGYVIASAAGDVTTLSGSAVERVARDALALFQESGQSMVAEPSAAKDASSRPVKAGETYAWRDAKAAVQAHADPAFLADVPRAFRDPLPRRAAQFSAAPRVAKPLPAPTYADLQPWLMAEPALRTSLLARWQRLASVPEFRTALLEHRKALPEWEPILFPPPPKPRDESVAGDRPAPRVGDRPYRPPTDAPFTHPR